MANFKTPGVYVEEIQTLAPSVAPVPTSIPGFVGYTEKAVFTDGSSALLKPVRITSLLEFEQIFGGPFSEDFDIQLSSGATVPNIGTFTITPTLSNYILYYQVQMFYANGGGTCYVVSADFYGNAITLGDLTAGLTKLEQVDEVTLLNIPEAVFLTVANERKALYDDMLEQCNKLQDRFALLDVVHTGINTIFQDAAAFRTNDVSADYLKYGAAYYPPLDSPIGYFYQDNKVIIDDLRTMGSAPYDYTYDTAPNNTLQTIATGIVINGVITITAIALNDFFQIVVNGNTATFTAGVNLPLATQPIDIVNAINNHPVTSPHVVASVGTAPSTVLVMGKSNTTVFTWNETGGYNLSALDPGKPNSEDTKLYNTLTAELAKYKLRLYPSSYMAGIYARVDDERGVWKAPANVSVQQGSPSILINDQDQENLNVDSQSGKSINAIRNFAGRGTLVWGARTLAGNDNEWRYVNVRRLFIFVEESIKKATEFVVFESNTATTWSQVRSTAEAFLTSLWRDGALAGATPPEAFYVRVGLGTTMTAQDILEGKMIVEIGLAAARPAEFIILRFSHKLQES